MCEALGSISSIKMKQNFGVHNILIINYKMQVPGSHTQIQKVCIEAQSLIFYKDSLPKMILTYVG